MSDDVCQKCRYYYEIEHSTLPDGGIFPGRGYCLLKPPVPLMDPDGKVIMVLPEVIALHFCAEYDYQGRERDRA
jgi:hypothetical protein